MHVPLNPATAQRSARLPIAAAVVALFASVVGVANAAEFDEKLKAPQARNSEQLKLAASAASQEFAAPSLDTREVTIRNAAQARRRFDARWTLLHAVEIRAPMGDMSEFGLTPTANGEIHIDLKKYPQWDAFEDRVVGMLTHVQLDELGVQLTNRGINDAEFARLKTYVTETDAAAMSRRAALPVTVSFGRVVRKYDKIKRAVPNDLVFDFLYQREAATTESNRLWLANLLDELGPHAARILLSYFDELNATAIWGPSDTEAGIRSTLVNLRLPDFEQRAQAEVVGGVK
jgi:hypothetical protein